jgi:DNA adenine methylase
MSEVPNRPALRWHGGKWRLAPWILRHFPPHRVYVEPFGGAASVLLRKARSYAEVYNDLDGDVVNLFRVLREPASAARLIELLALTPFARAEFEESYQPSDDTVERARRLVTRSFLGFGSGSANAANRTGFRANSNRGGTTPAHDWTNTPGAIGQVAARFAGVVIENRDATQVMRQHDGPEVLHYIDPPYLPETRSNKSRRGKEKYHVYAHELTLADHVALLSNLRDLAGMVVVSGYPSPLYNEALAGWRREEMAAHADGARKRTEVLWINPAAGARLAPMLFDGAAA